MASGRLPEEYQDRLTAMGVSSLQAQKFYETFLLFDGDAAGSIDAGELYQCLQVCGQAPESREEISRMLKQSDLDNSGRLDFLEFAGLMSHLWKPEAAVREHLVSSFRLFDKDNSGYLERSELHAVIFGAGPMDLTEEEFDEIAMAADANGDGRIDYEEFAAILLADITQLIQTTRAEMRKRRQQTHNGSTQGAESHKTGGVTQENGHRDHQKQRTNKVHHKKHRKHHKHSANSNGSGDNVDEQAADSEGVASDLEDGQVEVNDDSLYEDGPPGIEQTTGGGASVDYLSADEQQAEEEAEAVQQQPEEQPVEQPPAEEQTGKQKLSKEEQPTEQEQPAEEQPVERERPAEEQPVEKQPTEHEQAVEKQPTEREQRVKEEPTEEQQTERKQPAEEEPLEQKQPAEEQPDEEQPDEEQPAEEQAAEEQPAEEHPAEEQPAEEQPAEEQPAEEQPTKEKPAEEQPVEEQPAKEQLAEEQPNEQKQLVEDHPIENDAKSEKSADLSSREQQPVETHSTEEPTPREATSREFHQTEDPHSLYEEESHTRVDSAPHKETNSYSAPEPVQTSAQPEPEIHEDGNF